MDELTTTDGRSFRLACQGDTDALAALLERQAPLLRRRIGQVPARWQAMISVDDVMQQTYTDAFLRIGGFQNQDLDCFVGWLVTRARRNLADGLRFLRAVRRGGDRQRITSLNDSSSEATLLDLIGVNSATPSRDAAMNEASDALTTALEHLPNAYRAVVRMYDLEGRQAESVATMLGRSVGAVYMLRARAHERLSEIMGSSSRFLGDG